MLGTRVSVAVFALLLLVACNPARRARTQCSAAPPAASKADDLVDIRSVAPDVAIDIHYATTNNFTGKKVYPVARCLLRRPVAEALARVQASLEKRGLGLEVWDCYRPFSVQERFWALVPDERYVARPVRKDSVPVEGSKHNRGAAVDVTLIDASGRELPMPTGYDDFTDMAHRGNPHWSAEAKRNSDLLESEMVAAGFAPLPTEWWHFDGPGWETYPLADVPLETQ